MALEAVKGSFADNLGLLSSGSPTNKFSLQQRARQALPARDHEDNEFSCVL